MSKRRKKGSKSLYGSLGVYAILAVLFGTLLFMRVEDQSPDRYAVLDLADHPVGSAIPYVPKRTHFPAFYLVHSPDGDLHALVRIDQNSGCLVVWNDETERFEDPCEGHQYDWAGMPVNSNAVGLDRLHAERTEIDQIFVDMGQRFSAPEQ